MRTIGVANELFDLLDAGNKIAEQAQAAIRERLIAEIDQVESPA